MITSDERTVLSKHFKGGPLGLGDPDDRSLRKVETEVLIPEIIRDKAKLKCQDEVKEFGDCCINHGILMVIKCRKENAKRTQCLSDWYNNEEFRKEITELYLKERSEYRRTGIKNPLLTKKR